MQTILFQGDSITDAGRDRRDPLSLGYGYPLFAAGRLYLDQPEAYQILNRGVSGDRVVDVYARMKADILNLKPDVLSILIGVNDVWHELALSNGVSTPKYRKIYHMLLEEIREALPETRIILLEPFVLKGSDTKVFYDQFRAGVEEKAAVVRELAEEFKLELIPLQKDLDEMEKRAPEGYWLADGVHPKTCFHQYIADKWIRTFLGE